jgi:hypothetical protein
MTYPRARLSEVCAIEKGGVNPQAYPDALFAHYSIPAFDDGKRPAIETGASIKSQKTRISRGSVLVSKLNPRIPRVWMVDDDHAIDRICSTEFIPFKPDTSRLEPAYLVYALQHLLASGQITGTTSAATKSRERARPAAIADLEIAVPPPPEQLRIVDLLSRAEAIVRLRREAQKKAAEIIPALFLDMFGDPATNPKGWKTATLGELIKVKSGEFLPANKMDPAGTIPVYGGNGINGHHSQAMFDSQKIVIGRVGAHCGNVHLTIGPSWITDNALYVSETDSRLEEIYLLAALRQARLNQYANQVAQPLISGSRIYPVRLLIPPADIQLRFGHCVRSLNGIEALHHAATIAADATLRALLAKVFSEDSNQKASLTGQKVAAI